MWRSYCSFPLKALHPAERWIKCAPISSEKSAKTWLFAAFNGFRPRIAWPAICMARASAYWLNIKGRMHPLAKMSPCILRSENLAIRRFQRIQTAHRLACYLHGARIGVLVEYQGPDASIGKDVAMHI